MPVKKRVLFVDDEPKILEGLRRSLWGLRQEWEMAFTLGGEEALKILAQGPFDVVVSDMRMPGMNGAELLEVVRQRYPYLIRIALTGEASRATLLLCAGPAHRFLPKPTEAQTLKATIDHVAELRALLSTETLRKVTSRLASLPSSESLFHELLEELQSPEACLTKVAHFILQDVGMSTKVLHLVNSAFFGMRHTVASIEQAVKLLGLDIIKSLVLTVQVLSLFDEKRLGNFSLNKLWDHSMTVAAYAKQIAKAEKAEPAVVNDAYFSGLLHDVGKLVLAGELPEECGLVRDLTTKDGMAAVDAEQEVLGATHAEVGAYLLGLWGFANPIVEAIAYHHRPQQIPLEGFSAVPAVYVADILARRDAQDTESIVDMNYLEEHSWTDRLAAWHEACCPVGSASERGKAK